jgi:hypothetical protein
MLLSHLVPLRRPDTPVKVYYRVSCHNRHTDIRRRATIRSTIGNCEGPTRSPDSATPTDLWLWHVDYSTSSLSTCGGVVQMSYQNSGNFSHRDKKSRPNECHLNPLASALRRVCLTDGFSLMLQTISPAAPADELSSFSHCVFTRQYSLVLW